MIDDTNGGATERASLALDAMWRGAAATTRLHACAIAYRLNLFSNFTCFLDDPVDGDQFNQRDRRLVIGGALVGTWPATGPGRRDETTAGVRVRSDFVSELGLHRTVAQPRIATVRDDEIDEGSGGVFARNETHWSEWQRTEVGLRVNGYRFAVTSDEPRNSGRRLADLASPKPGGGALGPWAKSDIYANAGLGFHSNDARGTTMRVGPADGVTSLARSHGAEFGLRTAAVPGLVSTISLWALVLDSELVFVGDADLAATRARYREDAGGGRRIANSIARVVTAGVALGRGAGWSASARLRFFAAQPLVEDNSWRAPASTSLNARLGWHTRTWEIAVDVLNATDRAGYDIAYAYVSRLPGEPVAGVEDLHFHPTERRTWRLSATRRF